MAKVAFNNEKALFTRKLDLELRKKLEKCCIWNIALYCAETWKVDEEFMKIFEMWCWRRNEISWTNRVINEDVLYGVKEERNILLTINGGR